MIALPALFAGLKSKLASGIGVFIGILAIFIATIVLFNSDTILTKLGFETKTALKGQAVTAKKDLEAVLMANADIQETLHVQDTVQEAVVEVLEAKQKDNARTTVTVTKSKESVQKKVQPTIDKIVKDNPPQSATITINRVDADQVTEDIMVSLDELHSELFSNYPKT